MIFIYRLLYRTLAKFFSFCDISLSSEIFKCLVMNRKEKLLLPHPHKSSRGLPLSLSFSLLFESIFSFITNFSCDPSPVRKILLAIISSETVRRSDAQPAKLNKLKNLKYAMEST